VYLGTLGSGERVRRGRPWGRFSGGQALSVLPCGFERSVEAGARLRVAGDVCLLPFGDGFGLAWMKLRV